VLRTSHLTPPPGTVLEQACTPSGPELCFNAIDDNCNGVIDEGCGLQTGQLQFTIAWGGTADVNLLLETPGHELIPGGGDHPGTQGFHLDRDCPGEEGCHGQNEENIYFEGQDPPAGTYTVQIVLVDLHGSDPPVPVHFGARLGQRSVGFAVSLGPDEEGRKAFTFEVE
jgi:tRNA (guanosine-2'-O-)-methyltransferase